MIRHNVLFCALLGVGLLGMVSYVSAAEIKIDNQDVGTGQGLDDPAPASPVGGNPGTTRGEQARIVFQFAADLWGAVLKSDVPITVSASFARLSCDANSGVLGSADTTNIFAFSDPAPAGAVANTWYHSALVDALAHQDVNPGTADIRARFNGALGSTGCIEGASWYFGLDGNQPAGSVDFLNVVLHEMSHGLGFSGFGSLTTGEPLSGRQDIYSTFVFDDTQQKSWYAMTPTERIASARNDGNLVFTGANVRAEAPLALSNSHPLVLRVVGPPPAADDYAFNAGTIGPAATPENFNGIAVVVSGPSINSPGTNSEGCGELDNAGDVNGHVAIVDRGSCGFVDKALKAQEAGATAVLIVNNQPGTITPGGDTTGIRVPVGAISQVDGARLKANDTALTLGLAIGNDLGGMDAAGNVQLYAPSVLAQGSSFSHYDTRLNPNALMEYAINSDLLGQIDLDLTPALFKDEGWKLNEGSQYLLRCDTGVPAVVPGGLIVGANIVASAKLLAVSAGSLGEYRTAIHNYANGLATDGLLSQHQATALDRCLKPGKTLEQYMVWKVGVGRDGPGRGPGRGIGIRLD